MDGGLASLFLIYTHALFRLIRGPERSPPPFSNPNGVVRYHWKTRGSISTCRETRTFILKCSISEWGAIGASIRLWLGLDSAVAVYGVLREHLVNTALASMQQSSRDWKISYHHAHTLFFYKHLHVYLIYLIPNECSQTGIQWTRLSVRA